MHTERSHTPMGTLTAELTDSATLLETQTYQTRKQRSGSAHSHTPYLTGVLRTFIEVFQEARSNLIGGW